MSSKRLSDVISSAECRRAHEDQPLDTPHEVLVNKLCALLHRSELRDLIDIQALVETGCDLDRAIADAPKKDGGFSALVLGFTLQQAVEVLPRAARAGLRSPSSSAQIA